MNKEDKKKLSKEMKQANVTPYSGEKSLMMTAAYANEISQGSYEWGGSEIDAAIKKAEGKPKPKP